MADLLTLKKFETLSPFEIKDELIRLAKSTSRTTQSAFLNAGRGNPNWIATTPREGFFLLGQFAVTESKRVMEHAAGVGGMPAAKGIAARLEAWLKHHAGMPGAEFLSAMVPFAVKKFKFEPDAFVHELVDSIIGDNYPVPDRMLVHNEQIVHEYLQWAVCGNPRPSGKFVLYAVEGGAALKPGFELQMLHQDPAQAPDQSPAHEAQGMLALDTPLPHSGEAMGKPENVKRAEAKAKGYVGEACPECGNFTLVRNGTCLKCETCGGTTGCS